MFRLDVLVDVEEYLCLVGCEVCVGEMEGMDVCFVFSNSCAVVDAEGDVALNEVREEQAF